MKEWTISGTTAMKCLKKTTKKKSTDAEEMKDYQIDKQ